MNHKFLVDSHCHLDLIEDKGFDIDEVIKNAEQNGVDVLQTISTKISDFKRIYGYTQKYPNVFSSIGVHPCNVEKEDKVIANDLIKICKNYPKIIGIGETGLDYYHSGFVQENQIFSFKEHIKASRETGKPLIIHSRNADDDMINILTEEMKKGEFKALMHCFSSSKELAFKVIDLGIFISLSGIITFKNAVDLQNIVRELPLEFLLVETDAPYLAPMPYRGKENQPSYTKHTAEYLSDLKGVSFEDICQITTGNFFRLFSDAK